MTATKISKSTFQIISLILAILIFGFAAADIMSLEMVYGNVLGKNTTGLVLEWVIAFVLWIVLVIVFRKRSEMPSMRGEFQQLKEGGFNEALEKAKKDQ